MTCDSDLDIQTLLGLENHLLRLLEDKGIWISKLRTRHLKIPIKTYKWYMYNIARTGRVCTLYNECIID